MGRLEYLREQVEVLLAARAAASERALAGICKELRETLKEIEGIEGADANDDEIAAVIQKRDAQGKSRAVRKDRTKV